MNKTPEYLVSIRGNVRTQITKLCLKVSSSVEELSETQLRSTLSRLCQLETQVSQLDSDIAANVFEVHGESKNFTDELEAASEYAEKICQCKTVLQGKIANNEYAQVPAVSQLTSVKPSKLKLPELPLPTYSHAKNETLPAFLASFEAIIKHYNLSSYEKFVFLKRQLRGPPLILVESLGIAQQSYESAIELLRKAFASDVTQKFDVIRRLKDLKCSSKPYEFVSEMRLIRDLFNTLDINVEVMLQYFIWQGLTDELQTQLISICNNNKPSLTEIEENIFKAIDRLSEVKLKSKQSFDNKPGTLRSEDTNCVNFAAKVDYRQSGRVNKTTYCTLCSGTESRDFSHSTRDCVIYKTPQAKYDRLVSLNACTRCAWTNHTTSKCNYKFKTSCLNCKGLHMTFLCLGVEKSAPMSIPQQSRTTSKGDQAKFSSQNSNHAYKPAKVKREKLATDNVTSGVASVKFACESRVGENSILPTFTCKIRETEVRIMKDSGCQPNFIGATLAKELSLPVVNPKLDVTVHGFNESHRYSTHEVTVRLKLKNTTHVVTAIVIPSIKTELTVPGLGHIVKKFREQNFVLADNQLSENSDVISNIEFVLGTSDAHVLKETQVEFGSPIPSVYSMTEEGVLLMGNSGRLIDNLSFLREADCTTSQTSNSMVRKSVDVPIESLPEVVQTTDDLKNHKTVSSAYVISNESLEETLNQATADILDSKCNEVLSCETAVYEEAMTDLNKQIIEVVLENTTRSENGRLIMPLTWKTNASSCLASNANLAKRVLKSNEKKLLKNETNLKLMDDVFREQEELGVIERINDENFFRDNPQHSYIAHMGVFRMEKETTKCRVVLLSNLCQKGGNHKSISHNQAMHAGPCLNHKITTALVHLRFDEKLMCFDLRRAYLQIQLSEVDANRLLIYWYKNVAKKDFSLVTFRYARLPFGLRCAGMLLMVALYKILCLDSAADDPKLKHMKALMYALTYVDNGAVTGTREEVQFAYENLQSVFSPYKFEVQQLATNDEVLQQKMDKDHEQVPQSRVNLLGLNWDTCEDSISTKRINLDLNAKTKRTILSSIAQQYDVYGFHAPLLMRARLFMHNLQCNKSLAWDDEIPAKAQNEWRKIVKQANQAPALAIPRCVGKRSGSYSLEAYVDASKVVYAVVVYLRDVDTGKVSFLCAKNRIVNAQLQSKTVPTLELQAITLGVETVVDLTNELAGTKCTFPINIVSARIFTDSLIALHWLNSYNHKLEKMQNRSVFVLNRLDYIAKQCENRPITFSFTSTTVNPADCMTRPCSYKQLLKTYFISGVLTISEGEACKTDDFSVTVPDPGAPAVASVQVAVAQIDQTEPIVPFDRYSSFKKLVRVTLNVLKFIHLLKLKVNKKDSRKFSETKTLSEEALYAHAVEHVLIHDQRTHYPEVFAFFKSKSGLLRDIPAVVSRLNVFQDSAGLLRVKSKLDRQNCRANFSYPILLAKSSNLTSLIITEAHAQLAHSGCYNVLSHLRPKFWIPHPFSTVKKLLNHCVVCKRLNSRPVKLNQNSYRDFRTKPPCVAFRFVFLDYLGPYYIKIEGNRKKVWLLIVTCLWSRAINLKICYDLTVKSFLKAFQIHVFEHGLPSRVSSDLGSQLLAGANIIADHLNAVETKAYLLENGISSVRFEQYFKGNSSLGGLVEICVKLTKRLIYGSIRKTILNMEDFQVVVAQVINLMNKRPIVFREVLRDESRDVPEPLTPEMLVQGRVLVAPNVVPALESQGDDADWKPPENSTSLFEEFAKLRKARASLIEVFNSEYLQQLIVQGANIPDQFKPVRHCRLRRGDVILLKETHCKSFAFPLAVVTEVVSNTLGEVTNVVARKGANREIVKRHVTSVIPLICRSGNDNSIEDIQTRESEPSRARPRGPERVAKVRSRAKTRAMLRTP